MSYHIKLKEYFCPNCKASFIPYELKMSCPNCKTVQKNIPNEYLSFIDELIVSLRVNKIRGGSFLPGAWYMGSYAEHMQSIIFKLFYAVESKKLDINGLKKYMDDIRWDQTTPYFKGYVTDMALRVYSRKSELKVSFWSRLLSKLLT